MGRWRVSTSSTGLLPLAVLLLSLPAAQLSIDTGEDGSHAVSLAVPWSAEAKALRNQRVLKWPKNGPNLSRQPSLLYPHCSSRNGKGKGGCHPLPPCLKEDTRCIASGSCRTGNVMIALINSVWLAHSNNVGVDVSMLRQKEPGIITAEWVGTKPKKKCKPLPLQLLTWPLKKSSICKYCMPSPPGYSWKAGMYAQQYIQPPEVAPIADDDLVIHLRGEDMFGKRNNSPGVYVPPPCSWYSKILKDYKFSSITIVTSPDRNHPCIPMFTQPNFTHPVTWVIQTPEKDWSSLRQAVNLASMQTTYVISAAYLSTRLKLLFIPFYSQAGKAPSMGTYYDLGYAGRNVTIQTYHVKDYTTWYRARDFPMIASHPEEKVHLHHKFEV